jgi:TRAP-type C4-dicarboxylate transport system substrate-binding protein
MLVRRALRSVIGIDWRCPMETRKGRRWPAIAAGVALLLPVAACQARDRAGGNADAAVTVLTFSLDDGTPDAGVVAWADQVDRLSRGKLKVQFKAVWHREEMKPDFESTIFRDVQHGKVDLSWVGARVLDRVGVPTFQALLAPTLVDSYALQAKVFQAGIPNEMLASVVDANVVAVGVLPGGLRKVLGVSKPLVNPETFKAKRVGIQDSGVAGMTLAALGATAVPVRAGAALDGLDGYEQQLPSMVGNRYDQSARFVTGNINLWPRPPVIIMGRPLFDRLSQDQRRILGEAAKAATAPTLEKIRELDVDSTQTLCNFGMSFAQASAADLTALRAAVEPVYQTLRTDARTANWLEKIEFLKKTADVGPDAATCSNKGASASPLDGTWTRIMTVGDWTWPGVPDTVWEEARRVGTGKWTITFNDGVLTKNDPRGQVERWTYQVFRDRMHATGTVTIDATFHRDGTRLTFTDFSFGDCTDCFGYGATFGGTTNPWILTPG